MVTDAFVESGNDGQLHGDLQIDVASRMALEDDLDELSVQVVEIRIHVVQGSSARTVGVEVGLGSLLEEQRCLLSTLVNDAAEVAVELVAVDPARCFANVYAKISRPFDIGDDLDRRNQGPEITGDRRLQCDLAETLLLKLERPRVVLVIAEDDVLGPFEIAIEKYLGDARNELGDARTQPGDTGADLVELLVEVRSKVVHPKRPVT